MSRPLISASIVSPSCVRRACGRWRGQRRPRGGEGVRRTPPSPSPSPSPSPWKPTGVHKACLLGRRKFSPHFPRATIRRRSPSSSVHRGKPSHRVAGVLLWLADVLPMRSLAAVGLLLTPSSRHSGTLVLSSCLSARLNRSARAFTAALGALTQGDRRGG